jgi:hypothetical protein
MTAIDESAPSVIDDTPSQAVWRKIGSLEQRLANGREIFSDLKESDEAIRSELKEIAKSIAPKEIRWWVVIGASFGAIVTVLSVVWAVATMFAQRPTTREISDVIHDHAASDEHPAIRSLQENQIQINEVLRSLSKTVEETRVDVRAIREKVK